MKHLRKSLLALLALTLFGGAGAWAQGPTVKEITPEMIATGWLEVYDEVTANDFPGFVAIDSAVAAAWTGAPQSGFVALFYGFESDGRIKSIGFRNGSYDGAGAANWDRDGLYYQRITNGVPIYYTTGDGTIELTKSGANQWTLSQTPDYDLELQVEYYGEYNIDSIPVNWQVKVGDAAPVSPTAYTEGNTTLGHLTITETESVMLIPPDSVKNLVKSVTLKDAAPAVQTITIGGITLDITGCTTWADIIARNPDKLEDYGGLVQNKSTGYILTDGGEMVTSSVTFNPSANYNWEGY